MFTYGIPARARTKNMTIYLNNSWKPSERKIWTMAWSETCSALKQLPWHSCFICSYKCVISNSFFPFSVDKGIKDTFSLPQCPVYLIQLFVWSVMKTHVTKFILSSGQFHLLWLFDLSRGYSASQLSSVTNDKTPLQNIYSQQILELPLFKSLTKGLHLKRRH